MDHNHRKIIEQNRLHLQKNIDFNKLIPYLLEYKMFNKCMWRDIHDISNFLELLPTRGPQAFNHFIEVLKQADYGTEARLLQEPLESSDNFFYKMSSRPLGYCLIINNMKFDDSKLGYREGSDIDAVSLQDFFKKAEFEVEVESNLKVDQMKQCIEQFSKKNFFSVDSMVLIIMSHGGQYNNKDILYGKDGKPDPPVGFLRKDDIYTIFSNKNCKGLQSKPKVFIFIACRNNGKGDYGVVKSQPKESVDSVVYVDTGDVILPELSDMLIINSCLPNNVTTREHAKGTYFCKVFVPILNKYYKERDLEDMIKLVNQELKGKVSEVLRIVQGVHTENTLLEKKIMLCRKN